MSTQEQAADAPIQEHAWVLPAGTRQPRRPRGLLGVTQHPAVIIALCMAGAVSLVLRALA